MFTVDDKLFFVLYSCYDGIVPARLLCYIYILQNMNVDFKFSYKLGSTGLVSDSLDGYTDELFSKDMVVLKGRKLYPTKRGYEFLDSIILTMYESDGLDWVFSILDDLSDSELYFICLTDIVVMDVLSSGGYKGLISQESNIKDILSTLSSEYTDDNFNAALKLMRNVREL